MNATEAAEAIWRADYEYGREHMGHRAPFEYLIVTYEQWRDIVVTGGPTDFALTTPFSSPTAEMTFRGLRVIRAKGDDNLHLSPSVCVDLRRRP